jgi:hypothetical protein
MVASSFSPSTKGGVGVIGKRKRIRRPGKLSVWSNQPATVTVHEVFQRKTVWNGQKTLVYAKQTLPIFIHWPDYRLACAEPKIPHL